MGGQAVGDNQDGAGRTAPVGQQASRSAGQARHAQHAIPSPFSSIHLSVCPPISFACLRGHLTMISSDHRPVGVSEAYPLPRYILIDRHALPSYRTVPYRTILKD